jgi:prevent-host-death family protein
MSKQVSVTEAKRDLTKLLREIEEKQMEIVVTRRGEPYMIIVRYDDYERLSRIRAYLNLARISAKLKGSGLKASEIYEESRRELEERPAL